VPPKRGAHRAYLAVQGGGGCRVAALSLAKGARSRLGEDELVSRLLVKLLAEATGCDASPLHLPLIHPPGSTTSAAATTTALLSSGVSSTTSSALHSERQQAQEQQIRQEELQCDILDLDDRRGSWSSVTRATTAAAVAVTRTSEAAAAAAEAAEG
ncbi:hypothetical protein Agub_g4552, partial [Astrephomene gubernaculifera]